VDGKVNRVSHLRQTRQFSLLAFDLARAARLFELSDIGVGPNGCERSLL
jgi:hypothetical protein